MIFAASQPSLASVLPRLFVSMLVVIGVMWIAARVMKSRQIPGSGGFRLGPQKRSVLQILARQGVGRHAAVTVIRAGEKALVLGVTDTQISLLAELNEIDLAQVNDMEDLLADPTKKRESLGTGTPTDGGSLSPNSARTGLLSQIRERTVRR